MKFKFDLYREDGVSYIGQQMAEVPRIAAQNILSFHFTLGGFDTYKYQLYINEVDENTFEVYFLEKKYWLMKNGHKPPKD